MIYIGIDPSLTSTGICIFDDEEFLMSANIIHTVSKTKKGKKSKFTCKFSDISDSVVKSVRIIGRNQNNDAVTEVMDIIKDITVFYDDDSDSPEIKQIMAYSDMCSKLFSLLPNALSMMECRIGIEIPIGSAVRSYMVQRMFVAMCLSIYETAIIQICSGDWKFYEFFPNQIKKFISGKGNCGKDIVVKEVYKKFGFDTDVNDLADAYAIGRLLIYTVKGKAEG